MMAHALGIARRLDRLSDGRFAALASAPGLLLVALVVLPPLIGGIGLGFFRVELLRDSITPFIGLRNYATRMPADDDFLRTIPLTIGVAGFVTLVAVPVAFAAAALVLRAGSRVSGLLWLLLLLPWAVAPVASGIFWRLLVDENTGIVSLALSALGLPTLAVRETAGALIVLGIALIWRAIPLLGVLFVGALGQVPRDLGRAARMDGASTWQTFRHVTLPVVAPSIVAACILQMILTLQVFDVQFALNGGSVPRGAELTGYHVYSTVIGQISLGYGAAQAVVLGLIVAVFAGLLIGVGRLRSSGAVPLPETVELTAGTGGAATAFVVAPPIEGRVAPPRRRRFRLARQLGGLVRGSAIVVLLAWLAGPIVWILVASTQSDSALTTLPPRLDPRLALDGYTLLVGTPAWRAAAVNSVVITVGATLLALVVATLTAYPLARFRVRGTRLIPTLLLGIQLVPPIALAIPVLLVFIAVGLRNTVVGLIFVNAAFWSPILVWLLRAAFAAVPMELERAARIDGTSRIGAALRVILPAAAPAIVAAASIVSIGIWNDFVFTAMLGGRDTFTLPRWLGESSSPAIHILAARIVLTVAPCIALLILVRRRIAGLL